ncbi:MAG: hypothetical protein IJ678_06250 [Kiritimatiellae bacterium]|nr:hypothetical protein [Kiritimatiellia bacterium]
MRVFGVLLRGKYAQRKFVRGFQVHFGAERAIFPPSDTSFEVQNTAKSPSAGDRQTPPRACEFPMREGSGLTAKTATAGGFVVALLEEADRRKLEYVYLRNYENLPDDVGNDVDLLVAPGKVREWISFAAALAPSMGWRFFRTVRFGCHSAFFFQPCGDGLLHVDFNEGLEWHFIPFADSRAVLSRRRKGRFAFVPSIADELFSNVATRLLYCGKVREKHREQWRRLRPECPDDAIFEAFSRFGRAAPGIVAAADAGRWDDVEALATAARRAVTTRALFRHPARTLGGTAGFFARAVSRMFWRPGREFAFDAGSRDAELVREALALAAPNLAGWSNLHGCVLRDGGKPAFGNGIAATLRRMRFLAKNGVSAGLAAPGGVRKNRGMVFVGLPEPESGENASSLARLIAAHARDAMAAAAEGPR